MRARLVTTGKGMGVDNPFHKQITVIIIVRNGEKYLRQAIDSVLQSEAFIDEILIVDGQSTDGTREKIAVSFRA